MRVSKTQKLEFRAPDPSLIAIEKFSYFLIITIVVVLLCALIGIYGRSRDFVKIISTSSKSNRYLLHAVLSSVD